MEKLKELLASHYVNFPGMEIQDAVKFLYQHFMGPGHLIADEQLAFARLESEWEQVKPDADAPLSCSLGNGLCRLNLNHCKAIGLSVQTIARLFVLTASHVQPDPARLDESLDLIYQLPFPRKEAERFLTHYRAQGCPMVSHSDRFREQYAPAYRIVSEYYVNIIPALCAIDRSLASRPGLRVAIDGPCASGKSTLGAALSEIYGCALIHMDDFFLRPEQRTSQRLSQPGGNVDRERFIRDVLTPLLDNRPACYRPWNCHSGQFAPEITVSPAALTVVEGCYCLHQELRDAFDLRIWLEAPWDVRQQRLLARGGPDVLSRFLTQWIPLEDHYFTQAQVKQCCHVQLG